jgi:predicted transglutaminase-like cysteine proteinase
MADATSTLASNNRYRGLIYGVVFMLVLGQAPARADPSNPSLDRPGIGVEPAATAPSLRPIASMPSASASLEPSLDPLAYGRVVAQLDNFNLVPAWRILLQRALQEDALCQRECGSTAWQHLVADLRRLSPADQLDLVQRRLNRLPYRDDMVNWHLIDYWATPDEFLRKGGDCEDYAIAKYFALRAAGWPITAVRLMLSHRRSEILGHAYLIVRSAAGWLVLDNRWLAPYRPAASTADLWAGYSLNEISLWIHRNPAAPDFIVSSMQ